MKKLKQEQVETLGMVVLMLTVIMTLLLSVIFLIS